MGSLLSYNIGYTPNSATATSIAIQPPPVYSAGDLLVMCVIGGGTAGGIAPAAPSGWAPLSTTGSPLGLFTKTATATETPYTVSLAAAGTGAGFVAAYPAASAVGAHSFSNSTGDVVTFTPTFPAGVTSAQTVLLAGAAVASSADVNGNAGYQNVNLPSSWTTDVPVFGPALPSNSGNYLPCAVGLAEITGSTSNPVLTSPQGCTIYAGFLVLTLEAPAAAPYQVTATSTSASQDVGVALTVKALTGAQSVASIVAGGATLSWGDFGGGQTPQAAITPNGTGSIIYGAVTANLNVTSGATYTANSSTTFSQNVTDKLSDAIYGTMESKSKTTAHSAVTVGASAPSTLTDPVLAAAEILAATGATITEAATATVSATYPGQYATTAAAQTAVFLTATPPAGSLLVAMVSANSQWPKGNASFTVTDSLGLTWTEIVQAQFPSYAGVFIAQYPNQYTLSATSSGSGAWGDIALVFSGRTVTAVGNSASTTGSGAPSLSLTTGQANSAVAVIVLDKNAVSGTSRVWRTVNGYTPTAANGLELTYVLDASTYGVYVAYYPNAGLGGVKTLGLTAPAGMDYTIAAVEIQGTPGTGQSTTLGVSFTLAAKENAPTARLAIGLAIQTQATVTVAADLQVTTRMLTAEAGWFYLGPVPLTYPQYFGQPGTGVLVAEPGEFVTPSQVSAASGWPYTPAVPPPDGRWATLQQLADGDAGDMEVFLRLPAPLRSRLPLHGQKSRSAYQQKGAGRQQ